MKKFIVATITAIAFVFLSCASSPKVSGLIGLDEALDAAIAELESKLPSGSTIVISAISAYHEDIGNFIAEDLSARFSSLVTLAREAALQAVEAEQSFQMSGLVSDESIVGIGHYLGANTIVSGEIKRYESFTQLRLRAVDVETSRAIIYSVRTPNNDPILANINAPIGTIQAPRITENALAHLNRGKDLFAESKFDEAIAEFDKAIAINRNLAETYNYRGLAYVYKGDYDQAIADYTEAVRLNPNNGVAYLNRGAMYSEKGEYDRAIADYTSAIRIDPNYAMAYINRGNTYAEKSDYDRAIADYTSAIRLNPNDPYAYYNRGLAYADKGDFNRAIADFEAGLRIYPNDTDARETLEMLYQQRGR